MSATQTRPDELLSDKQNELDQLSINTLRFLAVDGVEKAKSGHPGAPLGCAPIAYLLYTRFMRHDPAGRRPWSLRAVGGDGARPAGGSDHHL